MIQGIGIDAVDLHRIKKLIQDKPKFITRILTSEEYRIYDRLPVKRQVEFLGGRYACKEAFSKAWGTGIGKITFQELEILADNAGAPIVTKSPHKEGKVFVSITHTEDMAFAQIILEK